MSNAKILRANGDVEDLDAPNVLDGRQPVFMRRLGEIVGGGIEFVWVEYLGKRTCMIVNETGALDRLPVNEAATSIYHTYPAKRDGVTLQQARGQFPLIYGDVALLDGVKIL